MTFKGNDDCGSAPGKPPSVRQASVIGTCIAAMLLDCGLCASSRHDCHSGSCCPQQPAWTSQTSVILVASHLEACCSLWAAYPAI